MNVEILIILALYFYVIFSSRQHFKGHLEMSIIPARTHPKYNYFKNSNFVKKKEEWK